MASSHDKSLDSSLRGMLVVIGCRGAMGSAARYGVSSVLPVPPDHFPWATAVVNTSGCFLLGLVTGVITRPTVSGELLRYAQAFLGVGLLGGFTTFSTMSVELRTLIQNQQVKLALGYVVFTALGGLAAGGAGLTLGRLGRRSEAVPRQWIRR